MISIIVPARNGADMTMNCLRAALSSLQFLQLPADFILIDDASEPRERMVDLFKEIRAQATGHRVTILRARTRLHYTGVFSVGIHFAERENVLFLSNDMFVTPHFLAAVLGVAALSAGFGIIRGTSNYVDSHPQYTISPPGALNQYADVMRFSASRFEAAGLGFAEDCILSGDAVLVKRAVIDRIGVLDCRFFGYFGDIDYGMRAHLAGFKLVCAKGAWLHHVGAGHIKVEAAARGDDMARLMPERMALAEAAYQRFREKWDPSLPPTLGEVNVDDYNALSERAPHRPELKCMLPGDVLEGVRVE